MLLTASMLAELTLNLTREVHVQAPLERTWTAFLEEIGTHNEPCLERMRKQAEAA
jgi:hypothetical protein